MRPAYDAVFITHYHGDHAGLAGQLLPGIPVYMGEKAAAVNNASAAYLGRPGLAPAGFLRSGTAIQIGDIRVTPYLCDHSAYDSYMLLLSCGGKSVLYTGDFRANGRKDFPALLRHLPRVDALITEGTTLNRAAAAPVTEQALEDRACALLKQTDGPAFFYMAGTNLDRCVTAYNAARSSGRLFLQDVYTASVAAAAGDGIPSPNTRGRGCLRVFQTDGSDEQHAILARFPRNKISKEAIARQHFLMCVRPSMRSYLTKLSELMPFAGGILFYSMWDGYKKEKVTSDFLHFMKDKGVTVVDLHTSGHADPQTVLALIAAADPAFIIPVHTENAAWFAQNTARTVIRSKKFVL